MSISRTIDNEKLAKLDYINKKIKAGLKRRYGRTKMNIPSSNKQPKKYLYKKHSKI